MSKTDLTKSIELGTLKSLRKVGTFLCREVGITTFEEIDKGIGYGGHRYIYHKRSTEIVDILRYDTSGKWYCYEIKISKSDFHSKCAKTFIGHYNYYIMTKSLYNQVKDEIPKEIGVYLSYYDESNTHIPEMNRIYLEKKAKKQSLKIDEEILKYSLMKSLYREFQDLI